MRTTKLSDAAREALRLSIVIDSILTLPATLDRTTYTEVDKVLREIGGKWDRAKKGHVFTTDPTFELQAIVDTGEVMLLSKNGFFRTPRPLADSVVGLADIWEGGLSVLEPSAGDGGLADVIREFHPDAKLTCVEIQPKLAAILKAKGHEVVLGDFLAMEPQPIYDRVVMNPPFEKQGDIDHITHAFKFLKPGGRMAAIGGGSWEYRQDKKAKAFRDFLDDYCMMNDPNEAGAFKESGTMVGTRTIVLWKPGK